MTREQWLNAMADELRPMFVAQGKPLPNALRISIGFPSKKALSARNRVLGQCWTQAASADGVHQIFISPLIGDGTRAADVLVHELAHAALPAGVGHKKPFALLAAALGLAGKPTATIASPELTQCLNRLIEKIGPYPHAALNPAVDEKKQSTRLIKVECSSCGYTCRVTRKWIEASGAPICPTDNEAMEVA